MFKGGLSGPARQESTRQELGTTGARQAGRPEGRVSRQPDGGGITVTPIHFARSEQRWRPAPFRVLFQRGR